MFGNRGRNTLDEVRNIKKQSAKLIQKGDFILHKSNSNIPTLQKVN